MSLTFTDDSDDAVTISAASSINNLTTFTHIQWLLPNASSGSNRLWTKEGTDRDNSLITNGDSPNNLQLDMITDGTDLLYVTSGTPLTDAVWQCITATYDDGAADPRARLYRGTLTSACVELTAFGTKQEATGNKVADAAFDLVIGNRRTGTGLRGFGGEIAIHHMEGRVMSLEEIISWQFHPRNLTDTRGFYHLGFNGLTNVPDWSGNGNVGTLVSTPTVGDHVPL